MKLVLLVPGVLISGLPLVKAFFFPRQSGVAPPLLPPALTVRPPLTSPVLQHARRRHLRLLAAAKSSDDRSYWLGEFATSTGELIQPYKVLGVSREATTEEIKQAYRMLSKKYHPDGMRHRTILPGSCNNVEEVREQWERIKLAYEILSRPKMRTRYDRKEFLADPAAAVQRAAVDVAVKGAVNVGKGIGKGLFQAGAFAFQQLSRNPKLVVETELKDLDEPEVVRPNNGSASEPSNAGHASPTLDENSSSSEAIRLLTDALDDESMGPAPAESKTKGRSNARGFAKRRTKL